MYMQIESYNSKSHYFSRLKSFWPVQNNQPVIDAVSKLKLRLKHCTSTPFLYSGIVQSQEPL